MTEETERIQFLLDRDGEQATIEWVASTLDNYRAAVASPASHASTPEYKPLFEHAIGQFEQWLVERGYSSSAGPGADERKRQL